jgi:hypothetical protein
MAGGQNPPHIQRAVIARMARENQQRRQQQPQNAPAPGPGIDPVRAEDPRAARAGAAGRHCWVVDDRRWPGAWPALILEWRQDAQQQWWGRCILAGAYSPQGLTVTDTWISAAHLYPASGSPPAAPQAP